MPRLAALLLILGLALAAPALAQIAPAEPPGPWVADIRGVTGPVPTDAAFYPSLASGVTVPSRGFGLDVGAHIYPARLGSARLGLGITFLTLRGTARPEAVTTSTSSSSSSSGSSSSGTGSGSTPAAAAALLPTQVIVSARSLAPQVSLNFGSSHGWSYLSAGWGFGSIATEATGPGAGTHESGRVSAINVGGGARWFAKPRLAIGFDIRMHKLGAGKASGTLAGTPGTTIVAVSVGISLR